MSEESAPRDRTIPYGEGRRALVLAAIRVVARDGLSRLTYRSLAAEAGVSHGGLQHHFSSIYDVLEEALEISVLDSMSHLAAPSSPEQLFDHVIEAVITQPDHAAFQYELFLEARRRPQLLDVVNRYQAMYRQSTIANLESFGIEPGEELVQVLMAAAEGMTYQLVVFGTAQESNTQLQIEGFRRMIAGYLSSASPTVTT